MVRVHVRPLESSESDFGAFFVSWRFATFRSFLPPRGFRHFNRLQTFAVFSPARFFFVLRSPAGTRPRFAGTFDALFFAFSVPPPGRSPRFSSRSPFPRRNVRRAFLCVRRSPAGTRLRFAGTFAALFFAFSVPPPKPVFVSPGRSPRSPDSRSLRRPIKIRRDGPLPRRHVFSLPILRCFANPPTRPSE